MYLLHLYVSIHVNINFSLVVTNCSSLLCQFRIELTGSIFGPVFICQNPDSTTFRLHRVGGYLKLYAHLIFQVKTRLNRPFPRSC